MRRRFGRLAAYDFLTLLGTAGVLPIGPDRLYLDGATGPLEGARALFGDRGSDPASLDGRATRLAVALGVSLSAMEDALCNWQKKYPS